MRSIGLLLVLFLGSCGGPPPRVEERAPILVIEEVGGCIASGSTPAEPLRYCWEAVPGGYRRDQRFLSDVDIAALRTLLSSHRETPPDLLAQIGISPLAVAKRRWEILRAAFESREGERDRPPPELDAELERYLSYDYLAAHILREVQGRNWVSTGRQHFEVTLPGEPEIRVSSDGLVPWKLPWKVKVGVESWEVADPALSRALLPLADSEGYCAGLLDGTTYWSRDFWTDSRFWKRFIGDPIGKSLSLREASQLAGHAVFSERFDIQEARKGSINMGPEWLSCLIAAKGGAAIDAARWVNPQDEQGQPTLNWDDFLDLYDRAARVVAREQWLEEWRGTAPGRTIWLDAVGRRGTAEDMMEELVLPAWRDAAFHGEPEYEIDLHRAAKWCGTVYLSEAEPGALIETAHPSDGEHWFDQLDFSFHPGGDPPTYGRVDSAGTFELRHMPSER